MSHDITLSVKELEMVMVALGATIKSGGGSPEHTLYRQLAEQTDYPVDSDHHHFKVIDKIRSVYLEMKDE